MSAIFIRKRFNIRNFRKFLLYSVSHDSSLRLTNPCLNRISRHECLASLAHKFNPLENSIKERNGDPPNAPKSVDEALLDVDYNVQRIGRVNLNQVEEIFSMIIDLGIAPTSTQGLYLLRCCGLIHKIPTQDRIKLTEKIWKKLQDLGCQYNISHYNTLLKLYVDCNHDFSPSDFLVQLEVNNLQPNKATFLYLLRKYCNDGNLDGASEILEFMREKGLPISESMFNALITGHVNTNDFSGAKDIFNVMRSSNLSPSAESYVALANGYAKNGDIDGVKSVLKDMEDSGVMPSVTNYLSIISSLSSDVHSAFVDEIISLMGEEIHQWRHEVLNTVITIIHKNLHANAFKLVLAISSPGDRNSNYNSNIFIEQLLITEQPIELVINYCNEIAARDLSDFSLLNAARCALDHEKFDHALGLFPEMEKKGIPVRSHNFFPILSARNSEKEILSTLKFMFELGVPADFGIYLNYVIPAIDSSNAEKVIQKIQETGQSTPGVIDALFNFYCDQGKSDLALKLMQNHSVNIMPSFSLEKFFSSHSEAVVRNPQSSFHQVLSYVLKNVGQYGKDCDVVRGTYLADLIRLSPQAFNCWYRNLEDFKVNDRCLDVCYDILRRNHSNLLGHVRKLESLPQQKVQWGLQKPISIEEEEKELDTLKKKGLKVDTYLQQLLAFHIREKNTERVKELISKVEELDSVSTPLLYCHLFNYYKNQDDFEMSKKYLDKLKENFPDFTLDTAQVLAYAIMLIKYSKFEEALDVIKTQCQELRVHKSREQLMRLIRRLFDAAIEANNMDLVRSIHSSLVQHSKDLQVTKLFYEPLIKMHLYRNDLDGAVQEFKSITMQHRITPYLNVLLKKCIIADDHIKLQAVIDAASNVQGRIPVLHDLLTAFLDTGRASQAEKVIENLGTKIDGNYLGSLCSRLYNTNNISELRDLLSMVGGFSHLDQSNLFFYLFKLYDQQNDYRKALDLYNEIERNNLFVISEPIKNLLKKLLTRNNVEIPSTISVKQEKEVEIDDLPIGRASDASVDEFHKVLEKGDAVEALAQLENMKKGLIRSLPLFDMTQLIRILVEKNLVKSLIGNVQAMSYIIEKSNDILHPLLTQYSEVGDVESLKQLTSFLPDFVLMKCSFNGFLCKAYVNSGRHQELLNEMENKWDQKNKVYSAVSFLEILSLPELKERAINLAKKYLEKKFDTPIAVVWAHYIINEDFDAAEKLEKEFPIVYERVDSILLRAVRQKEDIALAQLYVDRINKTNPRLRCKERAYGALLDLFVLKEMYSEAADLVKQTKEMNINLDIHYRSTLITLKSALERQNKPVPFTIPNEETIISA